MNSKNKIINAASKLFHHNGIVDTSVDQILEESGVSKSNFYYYFKSKIQLALTILAIEIGKFEKEIFNNSLNNKFTSPELRIENMYAELFNYNSRLIGSFCGNLAIEMSDKNELFRNLISDFYSKWRSLLEDCIEDGIKQGIFSHHIDKISISMLILSHIEGSILLTKTTKDPSFLKEAGIELLNLIKKK